MRATRGNRSYLLLDGCELAPPPRRSAEMKSSPHDRALDRSRRHRRRLHRDRRRRRGRDGYREHLARADARRHRDLNGLPVVLCGHQSARSRLRRTTELSRASSSESSWRLSSGYVAAASCVPGATASNAASRNAPRRRRTRRAPSSPPRSRRSSRATSSRPSPPRRSRGVVDRPLDPLDESRRRRV